MSIFKKLVKDRLFLALFSTNAILLIILTIAHVTNPYVPPYSGPVTVTGKYVKGYACNVQYTKPDGEKKVYWAGKPGKSVCSSIKEGPARMDGIHLVEARD
jgi:hypothetical protein